MNAIETAIPGLLILEPKVFGDQRGFFLESYNRRGLARFGIEAEFVQDNHSRSSQGVLRGLHYQVEQTQGKLVRVVRGRVFDVAVDLRRHSPAFGRWVGVELSEEKGWWNEGYGPDSAYLGRDGDLTRDPSQVLFIQDKDLADWKGAEALKAHGLNKSPDKIYGWVARTRPAVEVDGKVYLLHPPLPVGFIVIEEQIYVPLR